MNKISWSFRGTFSANNIPKFKDKYFSLIVNLSNEGKQVHISSQYLSLKIKSYILIHLEAFKSIQI